MGAAELPGLDNALAAIFYSKGCSWNTPGGAGHDCGGDDWPGDGARAVGDCQGGSLG